eukprot:gene22336-29415_t
MDASYVEKGTTIEGAGVVDSPGEDALDWVDGPSDTGDDAGDLDWVDGATGTSEVDDLDWAKDEDSEQDGDVGDAGAGAGAGAEGEAKPNEDQDEAKPSGDLEEAKLRRDPQEAKPTEDRGEAKPNEDQDGAKPSEEAHESLEDVACVAPGDAGARTQDNPTAETEEGTDDLAKI